DPQAVTDEEALAIAGDLVQEHQTSQFHGVSRSPTEDVGQDQVTGRMAEHRDADQLLATEQPEPETCRRVRTRIVVGDHELLCEPVVGQRDDVVLASADLLVRTAVERLALTPALVADHESTSVLAGSSSSGRMNSPCPRSSRLIRQSGSLARSGASSVCGTGDWLVSVGRNSKD